MVDDGGAEGALAERSTGRGREVGSSLRLAAN